MSRILIPILLSMLAGFVLGWSFRGINVDPAATAPTELAKAPAKPEASEAKPEAPSPPDEGSRIDRAPLADTLRAEDHSHEVLVRLNEFMADDADSYPPGESDDRDNPEVKWSVGSKVGSSSSTVEIGCGDGFFVEQVRFRFDPKSSRVEANVDSHGDTRPSPPSAWQDVSGLVYVSTLRWGEGRAVTLDYELHGLHAGRRKCTHGKVVVDL